MGISTTIFNGINPQAVEVVEVNFDDFLVFLAKKYTNAKVDSSKGDEQYRWDKKQLPAIKLGTYENNYRNESNLTSFSGIEVEHDAGEMSLQQASDLLNEARIHHIIYPSPSHRPEHPKFRILAPLSRPITKTEYALDGMLAKRSRMCGRINGVLLGKLEGESDAAAQIWFIGHDRAFVTGDQEIEFWHSNGGEGFRYIDEALDLDATAIPVEHKLTRQKDGTPGGGHNEEDLRLGFECVVDKRGTTVPVRELYKRLLRQKIIERRPDDKNKYRLEGKTLRQDSGSDSAGLRLTQSDMPCLFDVKTGVTHHLVEEDRAEARNIIIKVRRECALKQGRNQANLEAQLIGGGHDKHTIEEMLDRLVYLNGPNAYIHLDQPRIVKSAEQMSTALKPSFEWSKPKKGSKAKPSRIYTFDLWLHRTDKKVAYNITFKPGDERVVRYPESNELAINTWVPILRQPPDGISNLETWLHEKSAPFFDHVERLFNSEADEFLNYLAHIEQLPGMQVQAHWLHISPYEGTGRNWLGWVLQKLWEPYVETSLNLPAVLETNAFNPQLSNKIVAIVDEINEGGAGKWKHSETLKGQLTSKFRSINEKHEKPFKEYNSLRLVAFTNHDTGLPLQKGDRRFWVAKYRGRPMAAEYYEHLYNLLDDPDFILAVGLKLRQRDIDFYNPNRPPVLTTAKAQVIKASVSPMEQALDEVFDRWDGSVISSICLHAIVEKIKGEVLHRNAFTGFMRHYPKFEVRSVKAKVKGGGKQVRKKKLNVFVMVGKDGYETISDEKIVRMLEEGIVSVRHEDGLAFYRKYLEEFNDWEMDLVNGKE